MSIQQQRKPLMIRRGARNYLGSVYLMTLPNNKTLAEYIKECSMDTGFYGWLFNTTSEIVGPHGELLLPEEIKAFDTWLEKIQKP